MVTFIVCVLASLGAGIGTGFAGMSAASIITPLLFTFLEIPVYEAIGIALASDVLASAISAYTYKKSGNIDIKNALIMMICVISMTIFGSYISREVPNTEMSIGTTVAIFILGLKFLIRQSRKIKENTELLSKKTQIIKSIITGSLVGTMCGFMGAGGGMTMLFVLTSVLGYNTKVAVGTSVFIMTFTALTGSISHFSLAGINYKLELALCIIFTLLFARVSALIANKVSVEVMNRVVGITLIAIGFIVLTINFI